MFGIIGYWGYDQYQGRQQLEVYLGNKYQRAFYEMVENVEQIQVLLGKTMVSSSPGQNVLNLTKIWRCADLAQSDLNQMPLSESTLYDTAKFLNQAGDYAHVMAQKNVKGAVLNQKNREELQNLRKYSIQLSDSLYKLEGKIFQGKVDWNELIRRTGDELGKEENNFLAENINNLEEEMTKYPTLIYDGPFSDHIRNIEPRGLKGGNIGKEQARKKASGLIKTITGNNGEIEDVRNIKGRIPGYTVDLKSADGNSYSIDISQKGGMPVNIICSRSSNSANFGQKEVSKKGTDFLDKIGYPGMVPTFAEIKDNIAYISYAYQDDDILLYPDIIDLQVALDDGRILGLDALAYLVSHRKRELAKPFIAANEAKEMVSGRLDKIETVQLALIPQSGLKEILTYEVRGTLAGDTYLVYINALTGDEEEILQLVSNKSGTFSI